MQISANQFAYYTKLAETAKSESLQLGDKYRDLSEVDAAKSLVQYGGLSVHVGDQELRMDVKDLRQLKALRDLESSPSGRERDVWLSPRLLGTAAAIRQLGCDQEGLAYAQPDDFGRSKPVPITGHVAAVILNSDSFPKAKHQISISQGDKQIPVRSAEELWLMAELKSCNDHWSDPNEVPIEIPDPPRFMG